MFKLWFFFVKKRVLEAKHCYRYYGQLIVLLAGFFWFSNILTNKEHYVGLSPKEEILFLWAPVVYYAVMLWVVLIVADALQYTVFILDLPGYLKNKKVHFLEQNYTECKAKYERNCKPEMRNRVFTDSVRAFDKPADIGFGQDGSENNSCDSPVIVGGNRQGVKDEKHQVDISSNTKKGLVFGKNKTQAVEKGERYGIKYCSCNSYYKSYSEMPWWCRSCAFATGWEKPENDVGAVKPGSADGAAAPKGDTSRAELKSSVNNCVPEFVNSVSYIKASKSNKEKCSYLKHVIEQAPFYKVPLGIKAAIVLTLPIWLTQMLANPFPVKVISLKKYYSCCDGESMFSEIGFPPPDNPFLLDGNLERTSVVDVLVGALAIYGIHRVLQFAVLRLV